MDQTLYSPNRLPYYVKPEHYYKVFLGGSIEMGAATNWQERLLDYLKPIENGVVYFNPRRFDWDSSWEQKESNPQFNTQVTWEMDHLDKANLILFYFDPNTKSPITLMELGLMARESGVLKKILVYCPNGFWRKGNVDILCSRYGITKTDDENDFFGGVYAQIKEQAQIRYNKYKFYIEAYKIQDYNLFEQEIKGRRQLINSMVGTLYPGIVMDEIAELVKIRDQIFDINGKRRNN